MPRQKRPATTRSYHERVLRSLVEIERDPARPLALDALAREAFLSPFHFHRVFSALVGEGPAEYQRRLRLEQAAHDLALSRETIQRIAKRAGYARQESFTRAFRARFGSTPSAFRAEHRGKWTRSASGESRQGRVGRAEVVPPLRVDYLKATPVEVGLLFNFGPVPKLQRIIYTNDRKPAVSFPVSSVSSV